MSAEKKKELQVAALENGTAIDHIPPTQLFKVASLLGLENMDNTITIGNYWLSSKMGSKGMIKISDKFFCDEELTEEEIAMYTITTTPDQTNRQLFAQYPPEDVMKRSVVMAYFDKEGNERINQMWLNVRCFDLYEYLP